jgi:hypothetical protein
MFIFVLCMVLLNVSQHSHNTLWYCSRNLYSKLDKWLWHRKYYHRKKSFKLSGHCEAKIAWYFKLLKPRHWLYLWHLKCKFPRITHVIVQGSRHLNEFLKTHKWFWSPVEVRVNTLYLCLWILHLILLRFIISFKYIWTSPAEMRLNTVISSYIFLSFVVHVRLMFYCSITSSHYLPCLLMKWKMGWGTGFVLQTAGEKTALECTIHFSSSLRPRTADCILTLLSQTSSRYSKAGGGWHRWRCCRENSSWRKAEGCTKSTQGKERPWLDTKVYFYIHVICSLHKMHEENTCGRLCPSLRMFRLHCWTNVDDNWYHVS